MKAIIIGATGATGKDLVNVLLQDPFYTALVIFVRRSCGLVHPKLKEIITDFDKPEGVAEFIRGDVLFSCFGTTLKSAGSKEKQWHIDYEIPYRFAVIAKHNGVSRMVLLSAYGASASGKVFYTKLKGILEDALSTLAFPAFIIFRPGLLLRKNSDRTTELISAALLHFLNRLGLMKKFRPLPTAILAQKLAKAPKIFLEGQYFIELDKISAF